MAKETINSQLSLDSQKPSLEANAGLTRRLSLRIAKVHGIDTKKNTMSIVWLWPFKGAANNIEIGSSYVGFRSGIRFMPEIGSILVIGYSEGKVVTLSYLLPSQYENLISSQKTPDGKRTRIKELEPGEIDIYSADGAEIFLNEDVEIKDKNGDTIKIDKDTGTISLDSLNLVIRNEAGNITMGQIERLVDGELSVITDDGKKFTEINGGNALNELKIQINELSDQTMTSSSVPNKTIAEVTVGTVVDNEGKKVINQNGEEIVLNVEMASGAKLQIDKAGNINLNEGRATKATEVTAPNLDPTKTSQIINSVGEEGVVIPYTYIPLQSQQRAAREGDRITIPLNIDADPDLDHPGLVKKGALNRATMQQLASYFLSPIGVAGGPCTFTAPPGLKLEIEGEITQGANGVYIGSLNKIDELTENNE